MLKIIAIALLAAGCAALVAGIIIFVITGGLNLLKEIKQAKSVTFDYSTQNAASDIYYNKADNSFAEPKAKAKFNEVKTEGEKPKRPASHDDRQESGFEIEEIFEEGTNSNDLIMETAPLSGSAAGTAPLEEQSEMTSPLVFEECDTQNTAPLFQETDTAPLDAAGRPDANTAPLTGEDIDTMFDELTAPLMGGSAASPKEDFSDTEKCEHTQPLDSLVDMFEPLEGETENTVSEKELPKWQTAPLTDIAEEPEPTRDTAPLTEEKAQEEVKDTALLVADEEPVIDEISEVRSKRNDDIFVDFEKLFEE